MTFFVGNYSTGKTKGSKTGPPRLCKIDCAGNPFILSPPPPHPPFFLLLFFFFFSFSPFPDVVFPLKTGGSSDHFELELSTTLILFFTANVNFGTRLAQRPSCIPQRTLDAPTSPPPPPPPPIAPNPLHPSPPTPFPSHGPGHTLFTDQRPSPDCLANK